MSRIIFTFVLAIAATIPLAVSSAEPKMQQKPLELVAGAPDSYTVVKGDTLSGLAAKFLKDPHRWPELLRMNAQKIKDPHLIYPGQVLLLDRVNGSPLLKIAENVTLKPEVRATPVREAIPSIPQHAIEPYLDRPLILDPETIVNAPRIVATLDDRVITGLGDTIFTTANANPKISKWYIVRLGKTLTDPDNCEPLGLEAIYVGEAIATERNNDVLALRISQSKQEAGIGDYLVPEANVNTSNYMPRAPFWDINARIVDIYNSIGDGAHTSIVSISAGKREGIQIGHIMDVLKAGATVSNRLDASTAPVTVTLPRRRSGQLFVFRVFERISYALVISSSLPISKGDFVQTPG